MTAGGISPLNFLCILQAAGLHFFTGVPDSLLKDFNACLLDVLQPSEHLIAANEGAAIGLALGYYIASGSPALVYMQNSGLGNSVNPLVSLADPLVMGCPMLLLIGWRGEMTTEDGCQFEDEPQHKQQGRITLRLLDTLEIPYQVLDKYSNPDDCLHMALSTARDRQGPVALVVRKGSFASWPGKENAQPPAPLISREVAIRSVLEDLPESLPIVSTTGMPSRELFELREQDKVGHQRDLLCVGGMGHAVSIAAGIALAQPQNRVVCLDGDGAMLMHLGALTNAASCPNLIHVVLNNGSHDSVGGQPTRAAELDLSRIAVGCGYEQSARASSRVEIRYYLHAMLAQHQSSFLEILCRKGNRADLGRPTRTPSENRTEFMEFLKFAR